MVIIDPSGAKAKTAVHGKQPQSLSVKGTGAVFALLHVTIQESRDLRSCAGGVGVETATANAGGDAILDGPGHCLRVVAVGGHISKAGTAARCGLAHGAPQHGDHLCTVDGAGGVRTVGNALEVAEAVSYLTGNKRDERLDAICMDLCAEALTLKSLAESDADAREKLRRALDSGKAAEIFAKMVAALGGPADFVEHPDKYLPDAPIVRPVFAERSGYVRSMDLPAVGAAITALGGRRKTFDQTLDPAVGLSDFIRIGEKTGKDRPLAVIHARNEESFAQAAKMVQNKVQTSAEQPAEAPLIYETITNL